MRLILASASPRRKHLLRDAGFIFQVVPSTIEEDYQPGESPEAFVERLAGRKADQVAQRYAQQPGVVVLGADTIVVLAGEVLGKPQSAAAAGQIVQKLAGHTHEVITGIALVEPATGKRVVRHARTKVTFLPLSQAEIEAYVASSEPLDKAGAYGIQGCAARFVSRIEGCYFNVVGLPLSLLYSLLREHGWLAG